MNLNSFVFTLIFGGLKNTYPSENIPTISRKELKNREKTAQMFLDIVQKSQKDSANFSKADEKNLRFIAEQFGPQYSIQGITVLELAQKILGKGHYTLSKADTTQNQREADTTQNQRKEFEDIIQKDSSNLLKNFSELLGKDNISNEEKKRTLYTKFQQNPSLMLVCLSNPIQENENATLYQLMEDIFKNPFSCQDIVRLALSHYQTIGLFNVETILLPIIKKALNNTQLKPKKHQTLIEALMQIEEGDEDALQGHINIKQCPRIVGKLLEREELISDTLLEECASCHIPTLALDQINMKRRLSYTSSDRAIQNQQEKTNRASWRTQCIGTLSKIISERISLIKQQNVLLQKNPWLLNNAIEEPLLTLKETLSILKEIIEVSGHWTMPHNHLWAQANVAHIDKKCVALLLNAFKNETITQNTFSGESFAHSAARLGGEAAQIIQAIHDEPLLTPLLKQCCDYIGEEGSPLEIALKAKNNWRIIDILIKHTQSASIWKSLLQEKYREDILMKDDVGGYLFYIQDDYKIVSHTSYRRLNDQYRDKELQIRHIIHNSADFEDKPKALFTLLKAEDNLFKEILFDHLEYLQYILTLTQTNLASGNSDFPILKCKTLEAFSEDLKNNEQKYTTVSKYLSATL